MPRIAAIVGATFLLLSSDARHSFGATVPSGFVESPVAAGLASPTAMQFAPDGRLFVCEQGGRLRVIKEGTLLPTAFLTLAVSSSGERGLLGVAFDPAFETNHWVYVYYTATTPTVHNRISRFTAIGDVADPASEFVVFDLDDLSSATNHNGGALAFGPDQRLYAAVGENANEMNSQSMSTVLGKMLRLNTDGTIPVDNPFYLSASGKNRAIWALGLRNPFTFAFNPSGTELYINDVGAATWEEINDGVAGSNYGWPDTEGATSNPSFRGPRYAYNHTAGVCAITGGAFYSPLTSQFPSSYAGDYFFADFCAGWIRKLDPSQGNSIADFASGIVYPVDLKVGDDGSLYYLARGLGSETGVVYRIRYNTTVPVVTTHPASRTALPGASVTFSVRAAGTAPLRFQWQQDGVAIPGATSQDFTIASVAQADNGAGFRALVSNDFGSVFSNTATLTVSLTTNQPPIGTITEPTAGTIYNGGTVINYAGTATDPEDASLPPSAFTWQVDFHHDTHSHPFMPPTTGAVSGSFTIPTTGETSANVWYRISLTVRDSAGMTHTSQRDIMPQTSRLTLATSPAGLQVTLDGQPVVTPFEFEGVVGVARTIGVVTPQTSGNTTYNFTSWSDGGGFTHSIATPPADTTYIAEWSAGTVGTLGLFTDSTVADFMLGTVTNTFVAQRAADGEVTLNPAIATRFSGADMPVGWVFTPWAAGGTASVSSDLLTLNGARANTSTQFSSGRSIEFSGRFSSAASQHVGFGRDLNSTPWAIFSTFNGGGLYARSHNGSTALNTPLTPDLLNAWHLFRIDWLPSSVVYYVDGNQVASHSLTIDAAMNPIGSDFNVDGQSLSIDSLSMSPYTSTGTFTSRVIDAGTIANWGNVTWDASVPPGTTMQISVRKGNVPTPDGTWTPFSPVTSASAIGGQSRFLQYRASMTTSDTIVTPALKDIRFAVDVGASVSIGNVSVVEGNAGTVDAVFLVTVLNGNGQAVTVDYATADGTATVAAGDYTAASGKLSFPAGTSTQPIVVKVNGDTALEFDETFFVNLSAPTNATLSTAQGVGTIRNDDSEAISVQTFTDTLGADFAAGATGTNTAITYITDGEVSLAPTINTEFPGAVLPDGFSSETWNAGGTATVSGGRLTVDGARALVSAMYAPGRSLEFVATFSGQVSQHAGFGVLLTLNPWAIFSTNGSVLSARTNGTTTPLGTTFLGAPHRFRIDWSATGVTYFIDGQEVASHPVAISASMRPVVSDFNTAGGVLTVDWMRMTPYATSGTFASRVLDAGTPATWGAATWTADLPARTSLTVFVRQGNTPTPDAEWTPFAMVPSSGADVGGRFRYLQYQIQFATADPAQTAVMRNITFAASVP